MKKLNFLIKSLCLCLLFMGVSLQGMAQVTAIIQKSANVPTGIIPSGQIFTYTITFSIVGTGTAEDVRVYDNIPPQLEIVWPIITGTGIGPTAPVAATPSGTPVEVKFSNLPAGTVKQIQINVRFPEGKTCDQTVAKNTARLAFPKLDFGVISNEVVTIASAKNKMTLEKSMDWSNGVNGNTIWKIAIVNPSGGNLGGYNLSAINLSDILPTGATFVSLTDYLGAAVPITGSANWIPADMTVSPYYYQRLYYLTVKYNSPPYGNGSSVTNQADLQAKTPCGTTINLTASKTISLVQSVIGVGGVLTKDVSQAGLGVTFSPGCNAKYNIRFQNPAPISGGAASTITNLVIEDNVPLQTQITKINTPPPTPISSTIICNKLEYWIASTCNGVSVPTTVLSPPPTIPITSGFVTKIRWTYNSVPGQTVINTNLEFDITTCGGLVPSQVVTNNVNVTGTTTIGTTTSTYGPIVADRKTPAADFAPKIALTKVLSNCSYGYPYMATAPNNKARFRLVVANYGNQNATNCIIKDGLPPGLTYAGNEKYAYLNINWPPNPTTLPCSAFSATAPAAVGLTSMNSTGATALQWNLVQMPYMCGNTPQYLCIEFDVNINEYPASGYYTNMFTFQAPNYINNGVSTSNPAYLHVNGIVSARVEKLVKDENGTFSSTANLSAGANLRYKLRLINDAGSLPLRGMKLIDILPYNGDLLVTVPILSRGSTTKATLSTPLNLATVSIPTPTLSYNTNLACRNTAPSSLDIPMDLTGCNSAWSATQTASNNGAVRMDWGPTTAILPNVTAEVSFDATLSPTAQTGNVACNSFGFGFIPINTGIMIVTEASKVCVTTAKPTCCDKAVIVPTDETCCSKIKIDCPVRSVKVTLTGGTLTGLDGNCLGLPRPSSYIGQDTYTVVPNSQTCIAGSGIDINACFKATGLGTVTISYFITFTDGTTCEKKETKLCCCTPKITTPTTGCKGVALPFKVDTTCKYINGKWDFGDGTSDVANTTHAYNTVGSFTATFSYTNDCGSFKIPVKIDVADCCCEKAVITPTDEKCCSQIKIGCEVKNVQVTLTGGTFTALNWTCSPAPTGFIGLSTYTLGANTINSSARCDTPIVINACFQSTGLGSVTISYLITFADGTTCKKEEKKLCCCTPKFTVPTTSCKGVALPFKVDTTCKYINGRWDFGDGTSSTIANTTHVYNSVGSYEAIFTYTNDCGSYRVPVKIEVKDCIPCCDKAIISTPREQCCSRITIDCPIRTVKVTLTGGKFTALSWSCNPIPTGFAGLTTYTLTPNTACPSTSINTCFEATGLGTVTISYLITFADGTTCEKKETKVCCCTPDIKVSTNGCRGIAMPFTIDTAKCKFIKGYWNFGDGTTSNFANTTHVYNVVGSYEAIFYYTNDCGSFKTAFKIGIEQCTCDIKPCIIYKSTDLTAKFVSTSTSNYPIMAYHWDFGDGSWANNSSTIHTYLNDGVYKVCLTVYADNGTGIPCDCWKTSCLEITVKAGIVLNGSTCEQIIQPLVNPPANSSSNTNATSLKMSVFPNPVSNNLTVVFDKQVSNTEGVSSQLELYNLQGQLLKQQPLETGLDETKISMQQLPAGVYMISLRQNGQIISSEKVTKN